MEESGAAAQRAAEHARAAGDRLTETDVRSHLLATYGLGPRPFPEALDASRRTLEEARASGDRRLEQAALKGVAMGTAYLGDLDEARRLLAESRAIVRELGLTIEYWAGAQNSGRIAMLAGDLDEAARELQEGCEQLETLGETALRSTTAAILAQVEVRRGNPESAERWLEVAERTASPDDRASQMGIEMVRGLLLVARGDPEAERHLRAAVGLVDDSDATLWRCELRLDLARALPSQRREEAAALAREALVFAESKQTPGQVKEARQLLAELGEDVEA